MAADAPCATRTLVLAHRGASGDAPEHTEAAYALGVLEGADVIETDLVMSRDGVLVARHENGIGDSTDVADHPEFAARRTEKVVDGRRATDWWAEDFSWAELQRLRAIETMPLLRPANTRFDRMFPLMSLRQFLQRIAAESRLRERRGGRRLGISVEIKHPTTFVQAGLDPVQPVLRLLENADYASSGAPVWIQSFEVGILERLRQITTVRLLQLMEEEGAPADAGPDGPTYASMRQRRGLMRVASYADAIGVPKSWILAEEGAVLVKNAREVGLEVHVWTLRAENRFLSEPFRRGADEAAHGDYAGEVRAVLERCVDAIFADQVAGAVRARDAWWREQGDSGS